MEWACHWEAQDIHKQVLQELHYFCCVHAMAMEEVWVRRVALEHPVTQIKGEWQLVLECLEEMHQLWASIDMAIVHELRVTKH